MQWERYSQSARHPSRVEMAHLSCFAVLCRIYQHVHHDRPLWPSDSSAVATAFGVSPLQSGLEALDKLEARFNHSRELGCRADVGNCPPGGLRQDTPDLAAQSARRHDVGTAHTFTELCDVGLIPPHPIESYVRSLLEDIAALTPPDLRESFKLQDRLDEDVGEGYVPRGDCQPLVQQGVE